MFPICPLTVPCFEVSVLPSLYFSLGPFRVSHLFPRTVPNAPSRSFSALVFTAVICLSGSPPSPGVSGFSTMESDTESHFHISEPWRRSTVLVFCGIGDHYFEFGGHWLMLALRERLLASLRMSREEKPARKLHLAAFGDYLQGQHFVLKGSDEISFPFFNTCNFGQSNEEIIWGHTVFINFLLLFQFRE